MPIPIPTSLNFSSRSTSNSNVASTINAIVQNTLGGEAAPQSGGSATANPAVNQSTATAPTSFPSFANQGQVNTPEGTGIIDDTQNLDNNYLPLIIGGVVVAGIAAYLYL